VSRGLAFDSPDVIALLIAVGGSALAFNLLLLVVEVRETHLFIRLGWAFPMLWTRIPLADVASVRAVVYRPLLQAGGWGWRFGRFEGRWCRFYNARGKRGVHLVADGKHGIIGSQDPERLTAVLREICELNTPQDDTARGVSTVPRRLQQDDTGPAGRPV